ncbi:unnamed protein product [Sphenostylis stenocarpa]|uniref:IST1-like protein n=1 Tax=Sphenostylis stenocarpa TaxID=92480 RepID=A0AA86VX62_9FABA|nr:unnamed protein product [Sphenostylis stenocarpa]
MARIGIMSGFRSTDTTAKTALKLAVSRIRLLKNTNEGRVKQLRRELAHLLQSGHNHAARVRVEHVVMEEKRMGAYNLIEIYCELIAAHMPMIKSQKECPINLKEAISSVIFASPRCSDIPELVEVRKRITAKYGREFVSAAVELRPGCGLVEKLSTIAPDGPTKIKILIEIAEEYNIRWQPSLEENAEKLSRDLLVGPNTFEKSTYVEPPQLHVPPVDDERGTPSLRSSCQLKEMRDKSKSFYEKHGKLNPSGTRNQEMDFGNLYPENMSAFQKGRQNWEMEFKDAATAAQAAAESAERASVAARAAAELSNREKLTRQGSKSSSRGGLRAELSQEYAFHAAKYLSAGYVNSTFRRSSFEIHHEQTNPREQHFLVGTHNEHYIANKKSSTSGSSAYLYSDSSDSEVGDPKQNSVTLAHPTSDLSRRMLAPSKTGTCLSLEDDPLSKASKSSCSGAGGKSSRVSYESKDQKVSFKDNWGSDEHGSAEHAACKPSSEPKIEEPSSSLTKTMIPDEEEASKSLNCNEDDPSKERANHVHPKLPDYDTFAVQLLSRKKGRQ